ncbi:MAG: hypothetical protein Q9204_005889 [Flavoplaca sp. TL-2023a]
MPGIAGYYDNSANLQSDDRFRPLDRTDPTSDRPLDRTDPTSNDSDHLDKGHKIAMGVSAIPLFISLVAVTIYFVKRRALPPKYNRESLSATKMPGEQIRWEKPELPGTYNCETLSTTKMPGEQIRWEKPELPETCLVELAGGSIRELDNECIYEAGSRHSRISATWREVLASIWSLRRTTQDSPASPRAPNNSVRDV